MGSRSVSIESKSDKTLMELIKEKGRPVASSCFGEGVCKKCVVDVVSGFDSLQPLGEYVLTNCPLSCQCIVIGKVTVSTPYW